MRRRFAFPEKLRLGLIFGVMIAVGFLAFKNMNLSSAINSAYNGFSAGNIISDYVMSDYTSMSEAEIQSFLKSKNPCNDTNIVKASWYPNLAYHIENGHFVCMADESFNGESAAHIIWQTAQDFHINPKVIIVLLEKEQGLVTDTWPNSTLQYRSATGYGCPDTAACDSQYYGFKNQVRNAAELFRYILDNGSRYYPVGNNYVKYNPDGNCGGSTVNIENRATSALYQYTPYQPNASVLDSNPGTVVHCGAYGNSNFYYYYTRWFGDTHTNINSIFVSETDSFTLQASSGKYLVPANNAVDAELILSSNAPIDNRQYRLERKGDYYIIKHIATGLVLSADSSQIDNGVAIRIRNYTDSCSQRWIIAPLDNKYTLYSACSVSKAIDIPNNSVNSEGLKVQLWDKNGTNAQSFLLSDSSPASVSDGTYIISTISNKAMDIVDGKTSNGTQFHTFNITYSGNQQYSLSRSDDGLYTIKNIASNKVLDVAGGSKNDGAAIQLYDSNDTCAQKWIMDKAGATGYNFRSACSGKAIDVSGGNIGSNFHRIQQYASNGTNAQVWVLREPQPISDGEYKITSLVGNNFTLDISGGVGSAKDGTNVQIYSDNGTDAQKFTLSYDSSRAAYKISNSYAKRVLDVSNASKNNGANIQIWNYNPRTCAQMWRVQLNSDNTYTLVSACSNKALDVSGGNANNGANVQIWEQNSTKAQKWTLTKI